MIRTADEWIQAYQEKNALWIHDGIPKRPHVLLTSGKHSNGFFNSRLVICDEGLLDDAASDLLDLFAACNTNIFSVNGVVGPQTGATKLAETLRYLIFLDYRHTCFSASPAKNEVDGVKSMVFSGEEISSINGQTILLCEDVITTGGSVELAASAVTNAGGSVLPFILVLVNRSGLSDVDGKKIVALVDRPMPLWEPNECPLCKEGSEALRPKDPENWVRLNATY
jgi:orotate phosphoribosyltransferase